MKSLAITLAIWWALSALLFWGAYLIERGELPAPPRTKGKKR